MGLLDTFLGDTPEKQQAMGLLGVGMMNGGFRQGAGLALQSLADSKQNALKQKLLDMQVQNYQSEIEQRKAAIAKQAQIQEMVQRLTGGGGSVPAAPGQVGSGSFGIVPPPSGMSDMPAPRPSGLGAANLNDIVALHAAGGPDLLNAYKLAREGFERKPGTFYEGVNGGREYIGDPTKGFTYNGGQVGVMPGFTQANAQITASSELPKAMIQSAGKVNLRKNPDGTESPVPELSENPLLGGMFSQMFGGQMPAGAAPAPQSAPAPSMSGPRPMVSPTAQRGADAEAIRVMQAELQNPNLPPADRAAIQRELQRMTAAQSMPGFPTPTMVRPGMGYGKTTAQETQEAATKAKMVKQAEADVQPTEQRQSGIAGGNYMLSVIDQAINHPGRETATGASATFDPRNYLPGTNAKGFQSLLDQIRGGTFMQAYQNLKGGGQITEVEGKKAENAIARLNTAQSDDEFLKSLTELRQVVLNGLIRQKAGAQKGGADASFAGDNSEMVKPPNVVPSLPKTAAKGTRARDTTTGDILEFNGLSWVKAK